MSVQYNLVGRDGENTLTVFVPGVEPLVAHETHPAFDLILSAARAGDESVADLFDLSSVVGRQFSPLSDRVSVSGGRVYLDGEPLHNSLTEQVLRFLEEGVNDWMPLVAFFENVQSNPNEHSREQLFNWLSKRAFTITFDGMIVGYKGVRKDARGQIVSIHQGSATVNGVEYRGHIPNPLGATVEMPRGEVQWDPAVGCHTGLHVGTYEYAEGFAQGTLLEVFVNPRDVVSVPTDCDWAKVRCCRYVVGEIIDAPHTVPVLPAPYDWDEDGEYDENYPNRDCENGCDYCDCV